MNKNEIFDVAIIGGGPAGIMAGITATESIAKRDKHGVKVVIIEKNERLGRKLLLTGGGRCNITQAEFNPKILVKEYGRQGQFLLSPLSKFGVKETVAFFESKGVKIKTERGGRIFPESDKALDVLNTLVKQLNKNKVEIMVNAAVVDFNFDNNTKTIKNLLLNNKKKIEAKNYIICSGGKSYPKLGSTGDGFAWARKMGHTVIAPRPCLTPIKIKETWVRELQGLSLKNTELSVWQNGAKQDSKFGELLFTHFGVSGPIVLDASKKVGDLLGLKKEIKIILDLKPGLTAGELDKRLQKDFQKYSNKQFRNALNDLLPQKIIPIIVRLSGINASKHVNKISKEERLNLATLLKKLEMTVSELMGFDNAIITCGGVSLNEVDSKTMKSKIVDNLFFAGEVLDIDGPCGGYNLQACWTTGYVAGLNASQPKTAL